MASQWFFSADGVQDGPVSSRQLKELAVSGKLTPQDWVWKDGFDEWVPASRVRGLFDDHPAQGAPEAESAAESAATQPTATGLSATGSSAGASLASPSGVRPLPTYLSPASASAPSEDLKAKKPISAENTDEPRDERSEHRTFEPVVVDPSNRSDPGEDEEIDEVDGEPDETEQDALLHDRQSVEALPGDNLAAENLPQENLPEEALSGKDLLEAAPAAERLAGVIATGEETLPVSEPIIDESEDLQAIQPPSEIDNVPPPDEMTPQEEISAGSPVSMFNGVGGLDDLPLVSEQSLSVVVEPVVPSFWRSEGATLIQGLDLRGALLRGLDLTDAQISESQIEGLRIEGILIKPLLDNVKRQTDA